MTMLTDLRNRGVRDVLIACCDGLKGLPAAINATWPAVSELVNRYENLQAFLGGGEPGPATADDADTRACITAERALLAALQGNFQEAETGVPPVTTEMEKLLGAHHAFYAFASICALRGQSAEAVSWLRKAVETGMPNYPMFARDPNLAFIRKSGEYIGMMAAGMTRSPRPRNWSAAKTL
jgi:hypothetical protein